MKKLLFIVTLVSVLVSCSGKNVKEQLETELAEHLKLQVSSIKPLIKLLKSTEKKVVGDSVVIVEVVDSIVTPVDSLIIAKPNFQIRKYEMVSGTLISKLAIVDFHYIRPDKFDVFQRRVYRYNESIKGWEIHKKYMLKNSLIDDDIDKYLNLGATK